jgi:lysyl endopeptidase
VTQKKDYLSLQLLAKRRHLVKKGTLKKLPYILMMLLFSAKATFAQFEREGMPVSWGLSDQPEFGTIWQSLPELDIPALLGEDEINIDDRSRPYRFASAVQTDFDLQNCGQWTNLLNGDRIWILGLEVPGALSLSLTLRNLNIPRGGRVYFYTEDHQNYIGPLTSRDNTSGFLGIPHLQGSRIIIEYYEPFAYRGDGTLKIDHVAGAYRDLNASVAFSDPSCYTRVSAMNSAQGTSRVSSSVMMMMVDYGQKMATATMLNNSRGDATPYVLTASSSLIGPASSWVFYFDMNQFRCADFYNCDLRAISGASIVRNDTEQGVGLLRLSTPPMSSWDTFYCGWTVGTNTESPSPVCLHHGEALPLAFTRYSDDWSESIVNGRDLINLEMAQQGRTFQGSLGAPLFDSDWNLIGVFTGGNESCSSAGQDQFALLSESWSALRAYLDPLQVVEDRIPGFYPEVTYNTGQTVSEEISFFPNPAKDWIYVRNDSESRILEVMLMNSTGQVIQIFRPDVPTISIDGLPEGLYIIQFVTGKSRYTHQLLVR